MVISEPVDFVTQFVTEIGRIGLTLQALGIVVVLAIIFQIIGFFLNRRRLKEIDNIKKDMRRIEGKINLILQHAEPS